MSIDIQAAIGTLVLGVICIWQGSTFKASSGNFEKTKRLRLFIIGGVLIMMSLSLFFDVIDVK